MTSASIWTTLNAPLVVSVVALVLGFFLGRLSTRFDAQGERARAKSQRQREHLDVLLKEQSRLTGIVSREDWDAPNAEQLRPAAEHALQMLQRHYSDEITDIRTGFSGLFAYLVRRRIRYPFVPSVEEDVRESRRAILPLDSALAVLEERLEESKVS